MSDQRCRPSALAAFNLPLTGTAHHGRSRRGRRELVSLTVQWCILTNTIRVYSRESGVDDSGDESGRGLVNGKNKKRRRYAELHQQLWLTKNPSPRSRKRRNSDGSECSVQGSPPRYRSHFTHPAEFPFLIFKRSQNRGERPMHDGHGKQNGEQLADGYVFFRARLECH